MTFRAPELFDVKTGVTLDEKVDIWVRLRSPSREYFLHHIRFLLANYNMLTICTIVLRMYTLRSCL